MVKGNEKCKKKKLWPLNHITVWMVYCWCCNPFLCFFFFNFYQQKRLLLLGLLFVCCRLTTSSIVTATETPLTQMYTKATNIRNIQFYFMNECFVFLHHFTRWKFHSFWILIHFCFHLFKSFRSHCVFVHCVCACMCLRTVLNSSYVLKFISDRWDADDKVCGDRKRRPKILIQTTNHHNFQRHNKCINNVLNEKAKKSNKTIQSIWLSI